MTPLSMVTDPPTPFNVQAFLVQHGSGLAKLKIQTPGGAWVYASEWIRDCGAQFQVKAQFLLLLLEAEHGMISDKNAYPAEFKMVSLPNKPPAGVPVNRTEVPAGVNDKPPVPPGLGPYARVVRNGGTLRSGDGTQATADGNWYVAVSGPWKMVAALGAGIPDERHFPLWDVRRYLGFPEQIRRAAKLTRTFLDRYADAATRNNLEAIRITTYEGPVVVPEDAASFVLLSYTPSLKVLADRPRIFARLGLA